MKPENMKNERKGNVRGRRHGDGYDVGTVYQYFKEAGGNIAQAMRLSEADRRVPRDKHTWSDCIERMGYKQRYRQETDEEWREFGQERQRVRQHNMDTVAETFEEFLATYKVMLRQAMKAISDKGDQAGLLLLRKDFAFGIEQFDRFFRMYLRAMGEPERIVCGSQSERPMTTILKIPSFQEQQRTNLEAAAKKAGVPVPRTGRECHLLIQKLHPDENAWHP